MPLVNGIVTAGIAEATRVAQTVIHRGAEAGIAVVAGERVDRAHAERLPAVAAGARLARRPPRERGGRGQDGREPSERGPREEDAPATGGLIDLQA